MVRIVVVRIVMVGIIMRPAVSSVIPVISPWIDLEYCQ